MQGATKKIAVRLVQLATLSLVALAFAAIALPKAQGQDAPAAGTASVRKVGTLKSISGQQLVLKADAGPEVNVTVQDDARVLRLAPGQNDLKSATPMTLQEIQVGDRMLVRGKPGATADSLVAQTVVVMKQGDVTQKQQQEMQDWQRRGTGGIVTSIDAAAATVIVDVNHTLKVTVKTVQDTLFRRYASDSIKFSDAQKSAFAEIKVGDQLRARGTRSADGKEMAAEEVISGTFRNIAGTITSIDAAGSSVTVKDILARKNVVVKLSGDSQMRKLPAQLAQMIAFSLRAPEAAQGAGANGGAPGTPGAGQGPRASGQGAPAAGGQGGGFAAGGQGPGGRRGAPDFQQMVNRLPALKLVDLQKEDAVIIVSTPGTGSEVTAITLLSGVEPILTAPNGMGAAQLLSGWNLSSPGGEGGPQ